MNAKIQPACKDELQRAFELRRVHLWTVRRSSAQHRLAKLEKLKVAIQAREGVVNEALHADLRRNEESSTIEFNCLQRMQPHR